MKKLLASLLVVVLLGVGGVTLIAPNPQACPYIYNDGASLAGGSIAARIKAFFIRSGK